MGWENVDEGNRITWVDEEVSWQGSIGILLKSIVNKVRNMLICI